MQVATAVVSINLWARYVQTCSVDTREAQSEGKIRDGACRRVGISHVFQPERKRRSGEKWNFCSDVAGNSTANSLDNGFLVPPIFLPSGNCVMTRSLGPPALDQSCHFPISVARHTGLSWAVCGHFCNSATTNHVCARIIVKMDSHLARKQFLFNHTNLFSTKGLKKSLHDFPGTILVLCENPVICVVRRVSLLRVANARAAGWSAGGNTGRFLRSCIAMYHLLGHTCINANFPSEIAQEKR